MEIKLLSTHPNKIEKSLEIIEKDTHGLVQIIKGNCKYNTGLELDENENLLLQDLIAKKPLNSINYITSEKESERPLKNKTMEEWVTKYFSSKHRLHNHLTIIINQAILNSYFKNNCAGHSRLNDSSLLKNPIFTEFIPSNLEKKIHHGRFWEGLLNYNKSSDRSNSIDVLLNYSKYLDPRLFKNGLEILDGQRSYNNKDYEIDKKAIFVLPGNNKKEDKLQIAKRKIVLNKYLKFLKKSEKYDEDGELEDLFKPFLYGLFNAETNYKEFEEYCIDYAFKIKNSTFIQRKLNEPIVIKYLHEKYLTNFVNEEVFGEKLNTKIKYCPNSFKVGNFLISQNKT